MASISLLNRFWISTNHNHKFQPQIKLFFYPWNKHSLLNKNFKESISILYSVSYCNSQTIYLSLLHSFTILSGCRGRRVNLSKQNQYLNISQCSLKITAYIKNFRLLTNEKYAKNYISGLFNGRYFSMKNNIWHTKYHNFKWMTPGYSQEPEFHSYQKYHERELNLILNCGY